MQSTPTDITARATEDAVLVARVHSGDAAAFDDLMARYKKPVLNFCFRLLSNAQDAEDAAQEVFVRVYQNLGDFKPSGKFSTWLFALAHNACIDRLRWRVRHAAESLDAMQDGGGSVLPAAQLGVVEEVSAREIGAQIAAAVAQLPADQRAALVLSEYHGMSYAEIAHIMKCSLKSVEARLHRAKQTLRGKLRHLLE
jgi:RNA polymerase sigma-70 factor (ECF subfamily)